MTRTILHLSASTRGDESATDLLAGELIERLRTEANDAGDSINVVTRRLVDGVPLLSTAATAELTTPPADRSVTAQDVLADADVLIDELDAADVVVIGAPVYNFGPPAALKAWADLVARAGRTFGYTEQGPKGLLSDRPVYIVAASGGTPIDSEIDFATRWLRHFLSFIGLTSTTTIAAEGLAMDAESALAEARRQIATTEVAA